MAYSIKGKIEEAINWIEDELFADLDYDMFGTHTYPLDRLFDLGLDKVPGVPLKLARQLHINKNHLINAAMDDFQVRYALLETAKKIAEKNSDIS
jgi:hypothetical protein